MKKIIIVIIFTTIPFVNSVDAQSLEEAKAFNRDRMVQYDLLYYSDFTSPMSDRLFDMIKNTFTYPYMDILFEIGGIPYRQTDSYPPDMENYMNFIITFGYGFFNIGNDIFRFSIAGYGFLLPDTVSEIIHSSIPSNEHLYSVSTLNYRGLAIGNLTFFDTLQIGFEYDYQHKEWFTFQSIENKIPEYDENDTRFQDHKNIATTRQTYYVNLLNLKLFNWDIPKLNLFNKIIMSEKNIEIISLFYHIPITPIPYITYDYIEFIDTHFFSLYFNFPYFIWVRPQMMDRQPYFHSVECLVNLSGLRRFLSRGFSGDNDLIGSYNLNRNRQLHGNQTLMFHYVTGFTYYYSTPFTVDMDDNLKHRWSFTILRWEMTLHIMDTALISQYISIDLNPLLGTSHMLNPHMRNDEYELLIRWRINFAWKMY